MRKSAQDYCISFHSCNTLFHQVIQLALNYRNLILFADGIHVIAETEHQVVNAVEMEMRARRAEREAQVARDEAWKERIFVRFSVTFNAL